MYLEINGLQLWIHLTTPPSPLPRHNQHQPCQDGHHSHHPNSDEGLRWSEQRKMGAQRRVDSPQRVDTKKRLFLFNYDVCFFFFLRWLVWLLVLCKAWHKPFIRSSDLTIRKSLLCRLGMPSNESYGGYPTVCVVKSFIIATMKLIILICFHKTTTGQQAQVCDFFSVTYFPNAFLLFLRFLLYSS